MACVTDNRNSPFRLFSADSITEIHRPPFRGGSFRCRFSVEREAERRSIACDKFNGGHKRKVRLLAHVLPTTVYLLVLTAGSPQWGQLQRWKRFQLGAREWLEGWQIGSRQVQAVVAYLPHLAVLTVVVTDLRLATLCERRRCDCA